MNHILVRVHFWHRWSICPRKLQTRRLNAPALEMPNKREALWTTIPIQFSTIASTPADEVSLENQRKTFKTVSGNVTWKVLRRISKRLEDLVSVNTVQSSAKAREACLPGHDMRPQAWLG